jgi:hypothetical protein
LVFIICLGLVLAPVLAIQHPPLLDYPNHLARVHVLTNPDDPQLAEFYGINWALLPNLGFDLITYALAQAVSLEQAGRIFLGLSFVVALSAPMMLHRALYGRFALLPLVAGALIFNRTVQMGFLSSFLGVGLAIWTFAIWRMCRRFGAVVRFAVLQTAVLMIFVIHLYAVAVLGVLIVMAAMSERWRGAGGGFWARAPEAIRGGASATLPFVLPFLLLMTSNRGSGAGWHFAYEPFQMKLLMLPMSLMLELSGLGLLLAMTALFPALIARIGGGRMLHPAAVWSVVAMLLLYLALPDLLLSSHNADWRLLVPLAFVLVGAAEDPFRHGRGRIAIALLVVGFNAAAAYNAWTSWRDGDRIMSELETVLEHLPPGGRLIPYYPGGEYRNAYRPPSVLHIATRAVITHGAMVPTVFRATGWQPLVLKDPYPEAFDLHVWLHTGGPKPEGFDRFTDPRNYVLTIRTKYGRDDPVPSLPLPADLVAQEGDFTLYRLRGSGG